MQIIGTTEARMGSSRLPGKTMMKIYNGECLLGLVVKRFRLADMVADVYVATTTEKADDPIVAWCEANGVKYFRGSEDDVLDRVVKTAVKAKADAIVQMGADSAYLDYKLIDELVKIYKSGDYDYVCSDLEASYPTGIYGHIVRVSKLVELNNRNNLSVHDREDVIRYIFEHPGEYKIKNVAAPENLRYPNLRFTVDYLEDVQLAREIYAHFDNYRFTVKDLIGLYKEQPAMFEKTKNLVQRSAPFIKGKI